jgi:restriction endonuclease S subunit
MNWPAYNSYKESGAAWLSQIPTHWVAGKVKHGFTVTLGKMYQGESSTAGDVLLPHLKAGSLTDRGVIDFSDPMLCWFSPNELSSLSLKKNDLLVAEGGSIGRCAILSEDLPGWGYQKSLNRVRVRDNDDIRFLSYLIQFATDCGHVAVLCGRSTIQHFTADKLANLDWPHPSPIEQMAIVSFLDKETAKIDTLIGKQEQLIATLREDRDATVAEAFEGLEPVRLRRLVDPERPMTYGILQCGESVEDGIPYIGPSDMPGQGQSPPRATLRRTTIDIAATYRRSVLSGGDIVVSIGPAYGKVAVVGSDLTGANLTQDTVRVAALPSLVDTRYLVWVLLCRQTSQFWDIEIMGATFRRLNLGTLARTPIPLPTLDEQRRIATCLDEETAKIDALIAKADEVIETLREYRSALITDAVTGKIDVRGAA